jgi:hypothetical protein
VARFPPRDGPGFRSAPRREHIADSVVGRHVDGGLRWANEIVATRAAEPLPDVALRDLSAATHDDAAQIAASLREAAAALVATLHGTGPAAQMWCPVPGGGAAFYARRSRPRRSPATPGWSTSGWSASDSGEAGILESCGT